MLEQPIDCLVSPSSASRPIHPVRPGGLAALLDLLPAAQASYLREIGFAASAGELALLPGDGGLGAAALGLGDDRSPFAFGDLPFRLPAVQAGDMRPWHLVAGDYDPGDATLGYALGAYRYTATKPARRAPACLVRPQGSDWSRQEAASAWMVRDLINTPANLLGPAELAEFAASLARHYGAEPEIVAGTTLTEHYPAIAMVGRGSAREPAVAAFNWFGSRAHAGSPLISFCGKGVCFDSGGYDLKPSAGMLRMKKDMGGAAIVLGIARLIMQADLPVRLAVRIGCVENSVSGTAMRPLDVVRTRRGLTVEIGNTDAEGRLVLCDLLADASDEGPDLLLDAATLTGAARVALGPDLPALFCNDDTWAAALLAAGQQLHDPLWRLPLWKGYDSWLDSPVAELNNVASKPMAGAVVAALFLQRFVAPGVPWAHLDTYAWNDQARPGRPEGGEAQAMRAVFAALRSRFADPAIM
jgi:leucyl aminopeptidase